MKKKPTAIVTPNSVTAGVTMAPAAPQDLGTLLTAEFGKGFDASNLRYMRMFYQAFPIRDALRHELSWTHYRALQNDGDSA